MPTPTISPKQQDYIQALAQQRDWKSTASALALSVAIGEASEGRMDSRVASMLIGELQKCKPLPKQAAVATADDDAVTEAGMYRRAGVIFKVQAAVHGSGRLYAKRLVVESVEGSEDYHVRFEYAPGAVSVLRASDRMTLEEAKEFGALYGTCCVCGRTLTDEVSIAAGIGPVCGGRI